MLKHRTYSKMASGSMGRWVSAPLLMLGFYSMVPKVNGCIAVGHGIFQNGWFSPADVVIVPCPVSSMRQHKKEWRFTQHIELYRGKKGRSGSHQKLLGEVFMLLISKSIHSLIDRLYIAVFTLINVFCSCIKSIQIFQLCCNIINYYHMLYMSHIGNTSGQNPFLPPTEWPLGRTWHSGSRRNHR